MSLKELSTICCSCNSHHTINELDLLFTRFDPIFRLSNSRPWYHVSVCLCVIRLCIPSAW